MKRSIMLAIAMAAGSLPPAFAEPALSQLEGASGQQARLSQGPGQSYRPFGDRRPSPALDAELRAAAKDGFKVCRYGVWYLSKVEWFFDCAANKLPYLANGIIPADIYFLKPDYCVEGDYAAAAPYLGLFARALVELGALEKINSAGPGADGRFVLDAVYPKENCLSWVKIGTDNEGGDMLSCERSELVHEPLKITYRRCDEVRRERPTMEVK